MSTRQRYWIIAPLESFLQGFDEAWQYDLKNGTIAIGWNWLGDISKLNTEEKLKKRYMQNSEKDSPSSRSVIWKFYHEISVGDIVIARRGRKKLIGIGEVVGTAFYDVNKGKERKGNIDDDYWLPNFLKVKWEEKVIDYDRQVFSMLTLYEILEEKYNFLVKGKIPTDGEEPNEEQQEFVLEKHLEDFIVKNLNKIFGDKLKLYEDEEGGNGQQYPTDIGYIDILATEPETNSYVVIELKKGRESDNVVGQILRYIGWVKENLAKEGENVKGLIICKDTTGEKLSYALKAIPGCNIEVNRYEIDFRLLK